MNNPLHANLRDVGIIEEKICDDGETEEDSGGEEEEEGVEVGFLGGFGGCDVVGL